MGYTKGQDRIIGLILAEVLNKVSLLRKRHGSIIASRLMYSVNVMT